MADLEDIGLDQGERLISVEYFGLGPKKIVVTAFEGVEELSTLSSFRLDVISLGRALKPSEMLGQKLTVALRTHGQIRKFSGIISSFAVLSTTMRNHFLHQIELVPPLWPLTLNLRCRIFHEKSTSDIVGAVLKDGGFLSQLKSSQGQRDYTVEYGESDFNFISRLLEEDGFFYRFAYDEPNCPIVTGNGTGDFLRMSPDTLELNKDILSWQPQYRVGAASFKHTDWDFKAVDVIQGSANCLPKTQPPGFAAQNIFEYPGRFATADDGKRLARARIEEQEAKVVAIAGSGASPLMQAGAKFKIKGQSVDLPAANASSDTYAVLRVEHRMRDYSGSPFEGETSYSNEFVCMPADFEYRPPRVTALPQLRGPQTAKVTDGPDEFGRVKVAFPWLPDEQSCAIRVAQSWAFNKMGTQYLPRMGSEVVVEFLDGDPDRPIIVGMVYNGKNKLPFEVPANKTQSGMRGANWGDAGVPDKSNELRFEDLSGSEEIFVHAQKDFRRVVVNDDKLTVEQGDRTVKIEKGNVSETLNMGDHTTSLSQGNHSLKMDIGTSSIEAMQSITLKVGNNSLTIDQTGLKIKGLMVSIEGQLQLELKGVMTTVNGDGMLTLKGAITMVN